MKNKKKLSIITICYNEPDVKKTCESIVSQTWQDFEWIVIDGGSNKETLDIFKKYQNRINIFVSEPDNGIYNAFNKGLEYINSEYVHFLNAGDYYYNKNVLSNVFNENFPNGDIIHGDLCLRDPSDISKDTICSTNYNNICPTFFINKIIFHPATFIKSVLFNKKDGFRFDENYKIVGDLEMWIVFAKKKASFCHIPLVVSIFNTNGISGNKKYQKLHNEERMKVFNKHFTKREFQNNEINYSLFERLLSFKNGIHNTYKIITILGFQIRIKRR